MTPHILDCLTQAVNLRFKGATFAQDLLLDWSAPQTLIDIFNNVFEKEYKMEDSARGSYYFKLGCSKYRKEDQVPPVKGIFSYMVFISDRPLGWTYVAEGFWTFKSIVDSEKVGVNLYGDIYYKTPEEAYIDLIKNWYENGIYPEDNIINERESNDANEDGY